MLTKKLGFGLMRLPRVSGVIDVKAVAKMADEFLAKGFTYFDTAYVYGGSEVAFREAVVKRHPRESYTIASKMAGWLLTEEFGPADMFNESLERAGVEYFDYYLLHSLQSSRIAAYDQFDCWNFGLKMKAEGKIRNFGFSFHGDPQLLDELLTKHPEVDFVQLQLNYADWEDGAICAGENYAVCRKHNKPIVVMEPVKGGMLATLKPGLPEIFASLENAGSAASYALRYIGGLDGIMMILSGMSNQTQMEDNLETFTDFKPLNDTEMAAVETVKKGLLSGDTVPCTSCRYCVEGCPMNINIPDVFKSYNMIKTYGDWNRPHLYYDNMIAMGAGRASECVGCGQCEAACPQHISIIDTLKKASELLDNK